MSVRPGNQRLSFLQRAGWRPAKIALKSDPGRVALSDGLLALITQTRIALTGNLDTVCSLGVQGKVPAAWCKCGDCEGFARSIKSP